MIDSRTRQRLDGINLLLEKVFGEGTRLSQLLADDLDEAAIRRLRNEVLPRFLETLTASWEAFLREVLPERHVAVMLERFSFDGRPAPTLATLAEKMGRSREGIRQLQVKGARRIGGKRRGELVRRAVQVSMTSENDGGLVTLIEGSHPCSKS